MRLAVTPWTCAPPAPFTTRWPPELDLLEKNGHSCVINIGGNQASLGMCPHAPVLPHGIITRLPECAHPERGLIERLVERGIPVIHLLNIDAFAAEYQLPLGPATPGPGSRRRGVCNTCGRLAGLWLCCSRRCWWRPCCCGHEGRDPGLFPCEDFDYHPLGPPRNSRAPRHLKDPSMRTSAILLLIGACMFCAASASAQQKRWSIPKGAPLLTRWAAQVDPSAPLPEYPRPQMVRAEWLNLNGLWEYAQAAAGEAPPAGKPLAGRILVPFPWSPRSPG